MKKMTKVQALYNVLYNYEGMDMETRLVLEGMVAQLERTRDTSEEARTAINAKRREKTAQARAALMEKVLPVLRDALSKYEVGVTAKELYANCADKLPEDFTALKVQAVLLREMKDEVIKTETKGKPNLYEIKRG